MLNTSNEIKLIYGSTNEQVIPAAYVIFTYEPTGGKVETTVDLKMTEENTGSRINISVSFIADTSLSSWLMHNFLIAKDKEIEIDGQKYSVVLADKKVQFKHFKKSNFRTDVRLNFKKKEPE